MKLRELLADIEVLETTADLELDIDSVAYDSRKVTPGSLFVASTGFAADGNRFIPMALEKGAVAVVTAKRPDADIPYVLVASDRPTFAPRVCSKTCFSSSVEEVFPLVPVIPIIVILRAG